MNWLKYLSRIKRLPEAESIALYWRVMIWVYSKTDDKLSSSKYRQFKRMCAERHICLNFCRGGGKTLIGAHWAVWRAIRFGEVLWAADSRGQLTELFKHLHMNPFVKSFVSATNRQSVELLNGETIHTVALTEESFLGKHVKTLVLDEVARMDEVLIGLIRRALLKGGVELFLSTPVQGTFYEKLCNTYPVLKVTYKECGEWLDIEDIEHQMELFPSLKAMYLREYCCEFTALDGAVFSNLEFIEQEEMNAMLSLCLGIKQGMDLNTDPGHVGVKIGSYNGKTYVLDVQTFKYGLDYSNLKSWVNPYTTEIEDGGANTAFLNEIGHIGGRDVRLQPVPAQFWFNRIGLALMEPIVVVRGSQIASDLSSLVFKNGKVDMNPHHWTAAFLHAIGACTRYFEDDQMSNILVQDRKREAQVRRRTEVNTMF